MTPYLVVGALAVVLNALSFRTLDQPVWVGAAVGLVNTPREWLLVPLALLVNWHLPRRRRLLVAAVAVLYLERVITYLYFAPTVLSWQDTTPAQTTPALVAEVGRWMRLDLARTPVDWMLVAVLLAVVVAYPRIRASSGQAAAAVTMP